MSFNLSIPTFGTYGAIASSDFGLHAYLVHLVTLPLEGQGEVGQIPTPPHLVESKSSSIEGGEQFVNPPAGGQAW